METATARHRRDARRFVRALIPIAFVVAGIGLGSGVVPARYPGPLIVVAFALAVTSVMAGDFLRGRTDWPVAFSESGDIARVSHWETLHGVPARLQTGRFLLLAAIAGAGAIREWIRPGWLPEFFGPGPGLGLVAIVVGGFFVMGSLAGFLHRPRQRAMGCVRLFVFAFLSVQLVLASGLVFVGCLEVAHRGTVAAFVRSVNPFEQAAEQLDLR